jgi:20S proteasome alpha/beta subunit
MSTIIGIKTTSEQGKPAIVIAADTQVTTHAEDDDRPLEKEVGSKLILADRFVMAYAGSMEYLSRFRKVMSGDRRYNFLSGDGKTKSDPKKAEEIVREALKNRDCPELLLTNKEAMKKRVITADDVSLFLLAANCYPGRDTLFLGEIDIYGNVQDPVKVDPDEDFDKGFPYVVLGSGKENAMKYVSEQLGRDKFIADDLNLRDCYALARGALKAASADIGTSGLDMAVLTRDRRYDPGKRIREAMDEAAERASAAFIDELEPETKGD